MADVFNDMQKHVDGQLGPTFSDKPATTMFVKAKNAADMPWAHVAATFVIVFILLSVVNPGFTREKQTPEEKKRMEPAKRSLGKMVGAALLFALFAAIIPLLVSNWDKISKTATNVKSTVMSIKNKIV